MIVVDPIGAPPVPHLHNNDILSILKLLIPLPFTNEGSISTSHRYIINTIKTLHCRKMSYPSFRLKTEKKLLDLKFTPGTQRNGSRERFVRDDKLFFFPVQNWKMD